MTDEFEKWMKEYGADVYYRIGDMQAAYSAGASAMREKCKEIADANRIEFPCDRWQSGYDSAVSEIASAIERVEI